MRDRLTDKLLRRYQQHPPEKRVQISDTLVPGLQARVSTKGTTSFSVAYRVKGKAFRKTLGIWPGTTIEKARTDARNTLAEKPVPVTHGETMRSVLNEYLEYLKRTSPRSWEMHELKFNVHLLPLLGDVPLEQISHAQLNEALDKIHKGREHKGKKVGGRGAAHDTLVFLRMFFRWCLGTGLVSKNPAALLRKPELAPVKRAGTVASDVQLKWHWWAADELARRGHIYGRVVQLIMLTACRRSEITEMRWEELDLKKKTLTIPEARYKARRTHVVPLVDTAVRLIEALPRYTGPYVFSSELTDGEKPFTGYTRAANQQRVLAQRLYEKNGGTGELGKLRPLHDFRVTVATRLRYEGFDKELVELVLGHKTTSELEETYQHFRATPQVRAALEHWEEVLMALVEIQTPESRRRKAVAQMIEDYGEEYLDPPDPNDWPAEWQPYPMGPNSINNPRNQKRRRHRSTR